eukprot:3526722-Pyramimonas_sp.AAC.2
MGVDVPVVALFDYPSVAAVADFVHAELARGRSAPHQPARARAATVPSGRLAASTPPTSTLSSAPPAEEGALAVLGCWSSIRDQRRWACAGDPGAGRSTACDALAGVPLERWDADAQGASGSGADRPPPRFG